MNAVSVKDITESSDTKVAITSTGLAARTISVTSLRGVPGLKYLEKEIEYVLE